MTPDALKDADPSRTDLKGALREALATYNGDPRHPVVAETIERLTRLNPTPTPARNSNLLEGNWQLISAPIFPGGTQLADGHYSYTLGRLAFNLFQPKDLPVIIEQVFQPVLPIGEGPQSTHDIVVNFTIASPPLPPLEGIVRNLGVCQPASDTTLQVQFTGGVLEPAAGTDLKQWKEIFEKPDPPASRSIKEWLQHQLLKVMFGVVPPKELAADTGRVEFQLKRSPKGTLSVLYLDEELRITKGQRETVLICERH